MSKEKGNSVVLPSDTRVEAEKYATYVPRITGDLLALILPSPPDPLEMGVKPIPSIPVDFLGLDTKDPGRIKARREKVKIC
jgi:hypothetical protein